MSNVLTHHSLKPVIMIVFKLCFRLDTDAPGCATRDIDGCCRSVSACGGDTCQIRVEVIMHRQMCINGLKRILRRNEQRPRLGLLTDHRCAWHRRAGEGACVVIADIVSSTCVSGALNCCRCALLADMSGARVLVPSPPYPHHVLSHRHGTSVDAAFLESFAP